MTKNLLFNNFPKCYQLFNMEGLLKQHVEVQYDKKSKHGKIIICYVYKGLYVMFYGELKGKEEFYEVQTRFKGFRDTKVISSSTILNEDIPGFEPIKIITKCYSLKRLMISASR